MHSASLAQGFDVREYETDRKLAIEKMPAIAEGLAALLVERMDNTIFGSRFLIAGYGVVGRAVSKTLGVLGGQITVCARGDVARAEAQVMGFVSSRISELESELARTDVFISAVPSPVLGSELLHRLANRPLLIDLASPPGSVDSTAASKLGFDFIWARGLGGTSPKSVGALEWETIREIILTRENRASRAE